MNDSFYNETVIFTISASYLLSMFIHTCILPPVRHIQYHQYLPSVRHTDTLGSVLCPFWWWGVRLCTYSASRSHSYTPWSCCSRSGRLSLPPPTHWCKTSSHTGGSLKNKRYFTSISRMDWCPNIEQCTCISSSQCWIYCCLLPTGTSFKIPYKCTTNWVLLFLLRVCFNRNENNKDMVLCELKSKYVVN